VFLVIATERGAGDAGTRGYAGGHVTRTCLLLCHTQLPLPEHTQPATGPHPPRGTHNNTMEWLFGKEDDGIAALGLSDNPPMVAPAGSYQVRVRVVEAKDLSAILNFSLYKSMMSLSWKTNVEAEDKLPNCVAVVKLCRDGFKPQKRKTIVEKETSSPLWNQLFYYEDVEVADGELEACTVTIHVKDKTSIGRSLTIGSCDLNLASVYLNEGHEVWNEWLTLTDTRGKREGSQGQICVCVTVLRSSDEPVPHGDDETDDEGGFVVRISQSPHSSD
jgi:hypothetical protein